MIKGRAQSLLTIAGAMGTAWILGCMNPTDSAQNNQSMAMSQAGSSDSSEQGGGVGKATICHIPPGNPANAHTITVGNPAVPAHLAHGDKLGACKDVAPKAKPCSDNPGSGPSHEALAPERSGGKVAICHIPPGNPANAHTIVVGAAAVKAHLAHGDYLGTCKAETTPAVSVDCGGEIGHSGGNHGTSHDGDTSHDGGSTGGTTGGTDGGHGTDSTTTPPSGGLNF